MQHLKDVRELTNIKGKRVFLRVDFNVPIMDGTVIDAYRIERVLPTIKFLQERGAIIILASHIGRKGETLYPVFQYLENHFTLPTVARPEGDTEAGLTFVEDYLEESAVQAIKHMPEGSIVLLENLRMHEGEEANDPEFVGQLARLADVYVNEAFAASHRAHASIVGVPDLLPHAAGLVLHEEILELSKMLDPIQPNFFILGGAKFETKLPLLQKYLDISQNIFVGGALSNDFFKMQNIPIGKSLCSDLPAEALAKEGGLSLKEMWESGKIILPLDVIVQNEQGEHEVKNPEEVSATDTIMDAGPRTIDMLSARIKKSKSVLWNGPLGAYENGFKEGTLELAHAIAEAQKHSVVGGGDTVAAIAETHLYNKFTFVSTGGGAMLEFLAEETLPGIEALK